MFYIQARKWGDNILLRWVDSEGGDHSKEIKDFQPELYFSDHTGNPTEFRDMISGQPVSPVRYDTIRKMKDAVDSYAGSGVLFGQHDPELQFLSKAFPEKVNWVPQHIRTWYIDIEVKSDSGFPKPEEAAWPVTAITVYDTLEDRFFVLTCHSWSLSKSELKKEILDKVTYIQFKDEREVIQGFKNLWKRHCPHIVTGWNVENFDMTYMINRISRLFGKNAVDDLSPFGIVKTSVKLDKYDKEFTEVDIYGVSILDYRDLYKKFTFKAREDYKLKTIAYYELDESKIDYSEEGSLRNLEELNPQKFIDYNISDSYLVLRINEKRKILSMVLQVAYMAKINLDDVFSPVRTWDSLICNHLLEEKRVPPVPGTRIKKKYEGAYVKEPVPSLYDWIVSFDLASLYPSTMRQWNMCPSTIDAEGSLPYGDYSDDILNERQDSPILVAAKNRPDLSFCANGVAFRNDVQGVLPKLIEIFYNLRVGAKKKSKDAKREMERIKPLLEKDPSLQQLHDQQDIIHSSNYTLEQAVKVLLNSLYGAAGNIWFRFYDLRIAEGITRNGKTVIKWAERANNEFLNKACETSGIDYCIAIDTDSNYYTLKTLVEKYVRPPITPEKVIPFLAATGKRMQDFSIDPAFQRLQRILNCRENVMDMKREVIASNGFWVAKKKYALDVYDNEGVTYSEPELKAMGLSLIMSSTPESCRDALEDAVKILLRKSEKDRMITYIGEFWKRFQTLPPEDIAENMSVSEVTGKTGPDGWPARGVTVPYNSRGAVVYNKLLKDHGLESIYERAQNGDKIKLLALKEQNPTGSHVIGFISFFPREFNLIPFIDYREQFNKMFLKPLESMCKVIGVDTEERVDIGGFFF